MTYLTAPGASGRASLNLVCSDYFEAHSAGLEPGQLNPMAMEVMQEEGIDISGKQSKSVFDAFKSGMMFAYVITVTMEPARSAARFFPASRPGFIGAFTTQRR